jgi:hypothetical protein
LILSNPLTDRYSPATFQTFAKLPQLLLQPPPLIQILDF